MNSFEQERIRQEYDEYMNDVNRAKQNGDNVLLKSSLYKASELLTKLADFYTGANREKALDSAKRMKDIADRIQTPQQQRRPQQAGPQPYNYQNDTSPFLSGGNNQTGNNGGGNQQVADEDVEGLLKFIRPEDIDVTFNDVIGLEKAKQAMERYVIRPMKDPEAYKYNYGNSKCIFLAGPPGTGKTTFAKAVAKEVGVPFASVVVSGIVNCLVGETAKNIDKIFQYAHDYTKRNNTKLILFFDEFEEIAKSRDGDDKTSSLAVPALLRNLEGMSNNSEIVVLAASNYIELIDKALFDRFRQIVEVPLPNEEARKFLFRNKFKDVEPEYLQLIDFDQVAKESEGLSGREITNISFEIKYYISDCKHEGKPIDGQVYQRLLELIRERKELDK